MPRVGKRGVVFVLLVVFVFSIMQMPKGHSTETTAREKALAFIETVLPINSSRYNIAFRSYSMAELPDIGSYKQTDAGPEEIVTYTLRTTDSVLDVICTIKRDVLSICQVYVVNGSAITDRSYVNVVDAAQSFLEKHQVYSKVDSTELIKMLSNVDPTKNTTITSNSLKLTINHTDLPNSVFANKTHFRWTRVYNGCEYPVVYLSFQNGILHTMNDQRELYSIGDTAVNISKEKAIEIAMYYIKNYSYHMSDDVVISNFNVTEYKTTASLVPLARKSNVLYPYWSVMLYLNQTYPGSINALYVGVWADSGEVFFCQHQGTGGNLLPDTNSNSETHTLPTSSESSGTLLEAGTAITMITVVLAVIAVVAVILKRRK